MLYERLGLSYGASTHAVSTLRRVTRFNSHTPLQLMYMGVPLGFPCGKSSPSMKDKISGFFKRHPTAKIVIIVDTHCLDNGAFVYEGHSPETFKACGLDEVSKRISM